LSSRVRRVAEAGLLLLGVLWLIAWYAIDGGLV
jgi:hypothetical protein